AVERCRNLMASARFRHSFRRGRAMISNVYRTAILAMAFAFAATLAHAQWTEAQRDEFYRDCLNACEKNQKVPAAQKAQCKGYCICVMEGAEKVESKY